MTLFREFCVFELLVSFLIGSRVSTHAVYIAYSNSLLARTLFLRGNEFLNISKN